MTLVASVVARKSASAGEVVRRHAASSGIARKVRRVGIVIAAGAAFAIQGVVQAADPANAEGGVTPLVAMEHAGLRALFPDARDAALLNAFEMIPARLKELPNEFPVPAEQEAVLRLVLTQLARPSRFGILYNGSNPAGGAFGYGVVLSILSDEAGANGMKQLADGLLPMIAPDLEPAPSDLVEGLTSVPVPFGVLSYGARQAPDGWRSEILFGSVDNPDAGFVNIPANPLGEAVTPVIRGSFDLSALTPAASFAQTVAGAGEAPEIRTGIQQLSRAGLMGANALKGDFGFGFSKTAAVAKMVVRNADKARATLGISETPLTAEDFRAIPADAVLASAWRGEWTALDGFIDQIKASDPSAAEQLAQMQEHVGIDIQQDIIRSLGGTNIIYLSDATGGGSVLSVVGMTSIKDRGRFVGVHDKILKLLNEELANIPEPELQGRIRISPWSDAGAQLYSIQAAGLPLPIEITYAITDKWLIAGLMPQSVLAAVRQAAGKGDAGLASRAEFKSTAGGDRPLVFFSMSDTVRTMGEGYPWISFLGSAIGNSVRSMEVGKRDPGMIVPTFAELKRDAKPHAAWGYWDDKNLVLESSADRSMLVNAAGTTGMALKFLPLLAIPAFAASQQENGFDPDMMMPPPPPEVEPEQGALPRLLPGRLMNAPERAIALLGKLEPDWMLLSPFKAGSWMLRGADAVLMERQ